MTTEAISTHKSLDENEMKLINNLTRRSFTADEIYTFTAVLCDNEVDRDFERFSRKSLEKLAGLFIGKTCILDHERKSANQMARIYDASLETDESVKNADNEPYTALKAKMYLPKTEKNADVITAIESGILKEVSISCSVERSVCGICGKEKCSHEKGKSYGGEICHRILEDPKDAYECSFVAVPAQRSAGVTKAVTKGYIREATLSSDAPEIVKSLGEGEKHLSKEEAAAVSSYIESLEKNAELGEKYHAQLQADILKFSALIQPELPRGVLISAMKNLGADELEQMEQSYRRMARQLFPVEPQLAVKHEDKSTKNNEFKI